MTLSYIAGFFDADGTIYLVRNRPRETKRLMICFTNTDIPNLRAIEATLGISGSQWIKHPIYKENHLQVVDLRYPGAQAERVMRLIEPYMYNQKKKARWKLYSSEYSFLKKPNGKYSFEEREFIESVAQRFVNIK